VSLTIRPFAAEDIGDAARLLAARHVSHRRAQPLLDERFEDPEVTAGEITALHTAADASGVIAIRDGRVVGYLLGVPKPKPVWGPNRWVEAAGIAVEEVELARDLYAAAATSWVADGATAHYALLPAYDAALVDAWSRLAFGQQHMHAIRPAPDPGTVKVDTSVIRSPRRSDIPTLATLELALPQHQGLSPVFSSGGPLPSLDETVAEWEEDFDDPDFTTFVADIDGEVLGSAVGCSLKKSSLHKGMACPANAGFLGFAAVLPGARGRGLGRRLGEAVLAWAADTGYESVVTDWRVTNLLSSRTWPRLGFTPTFVRMHRHLGY
jgi:GNAT superfamily N-acetyltransferase